MAGFDGGVKKTTRLFFVRKNKRVINGVWIVISVFVSLFKDKNGLKSRGKVVKNRCLETKNRCFGLFCQSKLEQEVVNRE
ncbi:MAG TPA: hypothetical protein VLF20_05950 [Patescibacteria group bacterium]|nr:hypothetical protein [Patescibacteria group bacterium]